MLGRIDKRRERRFSVSSSMAKYCVIVSRDDSDHSVFWSACLEASVYFWWRQAPKRPIHSVPTESLAIRLWARFIQFSPATSLSKFIVEVFSDSNILMLSSKQGPIISKWSYKFEPAFSNCKVEWITSLLGIMIFIGYQSEMGLEKYAWKKEGSL